MTDGSAAPTDVEGLFGLLGNETRMRIVRALWTAFDFPAYVTETREGTSFAALRERADVEDPGNFNYHLGELVGTLVADRDDGYVLTPLGYNLMRAIDRYAAFEYEALDERDLPDPCPFCGGRLAAAYRREILEVRCRDCGGLGGDGHFTYVELPSIGVRSLEEAELLDAAVLALSGKVRASMHGICWDCRAAVDVEPSRCSAHDPGPDGTCEQCDNRYRTTVDVACPTCGTSGHGPVVEYAMLDPGVRAGFRAAGSGPDQIGPWRYRLAALGAATEAATATDPAVAEVTFSIDGDARRVAIEARSGGVAIASGDRD